MNVIETKGLGYSYDGKSFAIRNLSMSIKKGMITAVLGGNGAGKSTLFLNLNGVFTPGEGEIYFEGKKVVFNKKGLRELRKNVGIVFQDPNSQLFSADVRSDIAFGALNMGASEETAKVLVKEVAEKMGVLELLERPTHALSFGQKKRVAMAGVLIMEPKVIILDEPTAGLDPKGVSEILHLLMRIKEETGVSVIIATHEIDLVPLYCDYVYVLDQGRVALEGSPKEIFARADELRIHSLRTPRIAHLMEILYNEDHMKVDKSAATISEARKTLKDCCLL